MHSASVYMVANSCRSSGGSVVGGVIIGVFLLVVIGLGIWAARLHGRAAVAEAKLDWLELHDNRVDEAGLADLDRAIRPGMAWRRRRSLSIGIGAASSVIAVISVGVAIANHTANALVSAAVWAFLALFNFAFAFRYRQDR